MLEMSSHVTILSLMRQRSYMVNSYAQRIESFNWPNLHCVVVEGDSTDDTYQRLMSWRRGRENITILKHDTGRPLVRKAVDYERFVTLSMAANHGLDYIVENIETDYILFLESDLFVPRDLIERLIELEKPVVSPMVWSHEGNERVFYDIWGFRRNGAPFEPENPTFFYENYPHELFEVDCTGSCVLARAEAVYKGARFGRGEENEAIVGWTKNMKEMGYSVWVAPDIHVRHPSWGFTPWSLAKMVTDGR